MWTFCDAAVHLISLVVLVAPQAVVQDVVPMTVAQGTDSSIIRAREVTVRTPEEWRTLWSAHSSDPAPQLDFSRSIVVGVFLGSRPTAGFRVEITRATVHGDQAVVNFVEHRPDPDAILSQVVTAPFHLVTLPSTVRTVRFQQTDDRR
jgi:hypothetical protein